MKPYKHAISSARKFGGKPEDYQDIHDFMDSTKAHMPDIRHRAILHNSFGCFLVEKIFGATRKNSDGNLYSPRDIAEQHCIEDTGKILTIQDWLSSLPIGSHMGPRADVAEAMAKLGTLEEETEADAAVHAWVDNEMAEVKKSDPTETPLDKVIRLRKEADEMISNSISSVRKDMINIAQQAFESADWLQEITWTQYTPYFNDGDECVFSVNDIWFCGGEEYEDQSWPEDRWGIAKYTFTEYEKEMGPKGYEVYKRDADNKLIRKAPKPEDAIVTAALDSLKSIPNDVYRALFGDHAQIRIKRGWSDFRESECDHD